MFVVIRMIFIVALWRLRPEKYLDLSRRHRTKKRKRRLDNCRTLTKNSKEQRNKEEEEQQKRKTWRNQSD